MGDLTFGHAGLPTIGVTMGDPAGIGPEICVKALQSERVTKACSPVIIGDRRSLNLAATALRSELKFEPDGTTVVEPDELPVRYPIGSDSEESGRAAALFIEKAVDLWRRGHIDAICTAPISKRAMALAGYEFPGHTEFLAKLTNTARVAMSFFAGDLRVVLLSTHMSLFDAIGQVTRERLTDLIAFSSGELKKLLGRDPKIAVAGLNPHASEGGMFGSEEGSQIIPAIETCREQLGIDVTGPFSPDTIFIRGHRGEFDAVIALYHDQATIPVKALAFGSAVNVTLGLPMIRTSVDHGTAFDIAGKGLADASSLIAAIELAAELALTRRDESGLKS